MRTKVVRQLVLSLTVGLGMFVVTSNAWSATAVPWLYEVAVPVESQSPAARRAASSDALLIMLSRATGLAHVPRTPEVRSALEEAESFYNEFRFASLGEDRGEDRELELVVQFDPRAVLALLKSADLPIWRSVREQVVVWLVLEEAGSRRILGAGAGAGAGAGPGSGASLVPAMTARARARGVALTFPLLDLEDQLAVTPAAVWGRLSQVLDPASERYGADVVLVGRARAVPQGGWEGDWEIWFGNRVVPWETTGLDLTVQAVAAVDRLADELAGRSAVFGRQVGQLRVRVSGVRTAADYGELLGYLESLEFLDAVAVRSLAGDELQLVLRTRAEPDQLRGLLEADHKLFHDRLASPGLTDLNLVWRAQ